MSTMILHLRKTMCLQDEAGLTDAQLLERFTCCFSFVRGRKRASSCTVVLLTERSHERWIRNSSDARFPCQHRG